MVKLQKIVDFLDKYLDIKGIEDKSWNGLQFQGKDEVHKIVFAVDCAVDTFRMAEKEGADMVVVHHGAFWKYSDPSFTRANKRRLDILYRNQISLYAVHLPLDRHKTVGNNAELIRLMGGRIRRGFAFHAGKNVGWIGEFRKPLLLKDIIGKLEKHLETKCIALPFGRQKIRTVAVCSGGGSYGNYDEAVAARADCFLTGDTSELYHSAKDMEMNVIFAGHHATETVGVLALSKVVEKKLGVQCLFVDIKTGL